MSPTQALTRLWIKVADALFSTTTTDAASTASPGSSPSPATAPSTSAPLSTAKTREKRDLHRYKVVELHERPWIMYRCERCGDEQLPGGIVPPECVAGAVAR